MAKRPKSVEIRTYQVGFGDCFLVSFVYGATDKRHVLIDFGTTGLPGKSAGAKPSVHMPKVAKHIAAQCGSQGLTAVIATHRHADHINGFGTDGKTGKSGETIKALKPKVVLQPWTEDPAARRNAKAATTDSSRSPKSFTAGLAAMNEVARMVAELASNPPSWMSVSLQKELLFLGLDNIANRSAVENLIAMGQAKGATAVWAHHGSKSGLDRLLPGVKVRVLGPPNLNQSEKIRKMRSRDPDQFWQLVSGGPSLQDGNPLANGLGGRSTGNTAAPVPAEARWFRDRLERLNGEQLLEIVRTLDQQMNNTSLILLFEVFGKKLLFPGDAQIENWSYALEDAPDAKKTTALLAQVDVYKVGHHGSLNATPRQALWENFRKRKGKKLHTLLSTMPGKHGNPRKDTEVPRQTLLSALRKESDLQNTVDLKFGPKAEPCHVLTVRA
jgi:beta-lactamase superfamily II metal-dependent hydrolase